MSPHSRRIQSVNEIYALLRTAGARKQPVAAMYEGHLRLFCPHLLGRSKQGHRNAFYYQFGGASVSGLRTVSPGVGGWRCIVVDKLSQVELQSGGWHTEPRSSRGYAARGVRGEPRGRNSGIDLGATNPR